MLAKVRSTFITWEDVYWLSRLCTVWPASGPTLVSPTQFLLYASSFLLLWLPLSSTQADIRIKGTHLRVMIADPSDAIASTWVLRMGETQPPLAAESSTMSPLFLILFKMSQYLFSHVEFPQPTKLEVSFLRSYRIRWVGWGLWADRTLW